MRSFVIHYADLVPHDLSKSAAIPLVMARRKRGAADLTGIRQRGSRHQVRVFGGTDPVTGKQVILPGSSR